MKNPDCTKCIHYFITLDEKRPRACRVFNIKGRVLPSIEVKHFTGHVCPVFEKRESKKKEVIKRSTVLDTFA